MKQKYSLLVFLSFLLLSGTYVNGQAVGPIGAATSNVYLTGRWLEIGITNIGAFGTNYWDNTNPPPASCHPYPAGSGLASVYDYGHDGWTVGTPPFFGDYTLPGTPFEGWGIQLNGTGNLNWAFIENADAAFTASGITGTGTLSGAITSYTDVGGQLTAVWQGTAYTGGVVAVTQTTTLDTNASWVVVTVVLKNTGTAAIPDVYYVRTCDPDNEETRATRPADPFETNNTIVYQNDIDHRVMVSSTGQQYTNAYMSLGTKDCRAKAFTYETWDPGMDDYTDDLSTVYNETAGMLDATYTLGYTVYGDYAIGLVYSLGTLAAAGSPGDSMVLSYAYIYNGNLGIDSALPDPQLVVNGTAVPDAAPPYPTIDTFNSCSYTGLNTVPVNIINAATGDWSWSTWTWAPALGLTTTHGVTNTINLDALPAYITYTITGTDSAANAYTCNNKVFYLTIHTCNEVFGNNPCLGDSINLGWRGDSSGATYSWTGPDGFASTQQYPYIYPATYSNTGTYYVTKTVSGVDTTDSVYVLVHYQPAVTLSSNSPICNDGMHTASVIATPDSAGNTYYWTGPPAGFSAATQSFTIADFPASDTGYYKVVTNTPYGCTDSATIKVTVVPIPNPPVVTDPSPYCQGMPFIPFTTSSVAPGYTVLWYAADSGGTGSPVAPIANTAVGGTTTTFYYTQIIGSCESKRDSIKIQVIDTPSAPIVSGTFVYCDSAGPYTPLTVTTLPGGTAYWSVGIHSYTAEPTVNTNMPGSYAYAVYQVDSGCRGAAATGSIIVNPKPIPPGVTSPVYCQFQEVPALTVTLSHGDYATWYGPGIPVTGTSAAPVPSTVDSGYIYYYVTQSITTLSLTCTSDSTLDRVTINPQPSIPITKDIKYCQFSQAAPLTAIGDSLRWYFNGVHIDSTPVPPTNYVPAGNYENLTTWYVTQSITTHNVTCQSDSGQLTVATIYLPDFTIVPSSPYVCQFDSINIAYTGEYLYAPDYTWVLPNGARVVDGTDTFGMPSIVVQFDSGLQLNYVYLTATDDSGFCSTRDSIPINVVETPFAATYSKNDVCLGDTTTLALSYESYDAAEYSWKIDGTPLESSHAVNIIYSNSNSSGPYSVSWNDTGLHVIELNTFTKEGCASKPFYDSINVKATPNASFIYKVKNETFCIQDSVLFIAIDSNNYSDAYLWGPSSDFNNVNTPATWGKVMDNPTVITLTVTDPFGCTASSSMTLQPGSCCTANFPSAFTPNNDGKNDFFRPIFPDSSIHIFHEFRIANRWGQTIFESESTGAQWDGTFGGVPQDMGVYYYYIKFDCGGNTVEQRGDVTLIR